MSHIDTCLGLLRRLIAKGDADSLSLAARAINEYLAATPRSARKSGLRYIQLDVLQQRNAVVGDRHSFAESVNSYIEEKLKGEGL